MTNKEIAHQFSMASKLMDIHGENSFRSKSYSVAAYKIEKIPTPLSSLSKEEIFSINGIGETIGNKIFEILSTGTMEFLEELIKKTPEGIFEIMKIKGLGPKKISIIWKEMGIENLGELLYACNENRLELYKGFGKKTQQNVIESIEFYLSQQGIFLYAQVESFANELQKLFQKLFDTKSVTITGDFARQIEVIEIIDFLIPISILDIQEKLKEVGGFELLEVTNDYLLYQYNHGVKIKVHSAEIDSLIQKLFETTGSDKFITNFFNHFPSLDYSKCTTEEEIFAQSKIQFIPPFLREEGDIISVASEYKIPKVIQPEDIKGIIHCHSNWSDGSNSIEELALACKQSGKEYLVLSDHSKSATYAKGLYEDRIKVQHELIDELNEKLFPFKIFKSIESDILNDGSLDYSDAVLSTFDLVIASVHSNLKMNQEKAMMRLMNAIENRYTSILGHMTGRLLLSRKGFPLDHKKIIDACAANNVVIEINAHPRRLDMRWEWISYALSKNILLSINPDAHSIPEFDNTRYGVLVAQKGMVTAKNNLSSFNLNELETFLQKQKSKR